MSRFYSKKDCAEVDTGGVLEAVDAEGNVTRYSAQNVFDWWSPEEIEATFGCVIPTEDALADGFEEVPGSRRLENTKKGLKWVYDTREVPPPLTKEAVLAAVEVIAEQQKVEEAEQKLVELVVAAHDGRIDAEEAKAFLQELSIEERASVDAAVAPETVSKATEAEQLEVKGQ